MTEKRKYDSTIARMAGNIAGSLLVTNPEASNVNIASMSVSLARAIVAEVQRTDQADRETP